MPTASKSLTIMAGKKKTIKVKGALIKSKKLKALILKLPLSVRKCCDSKEIKWSKKNLKGELSLQGLQQLRYLECFGNEITSLDVSNCTELTDLSYDEDKFTAVGWQA